MASSSSATRSRSTSRARSWRSRSRSRRAPNRRRADASGWPAWVPAMPASLCISPLTFTEVSAPQVEGPLEVPLGSVVVVHREVGHGEPMGHAGPPLDGAPDLVPLELAAKLVHVLGRRGPVYLSESE